MNHSLDLIFQRLLSHVTQEHYRFLYAQFRIDDRLTGLVGPRGVGKTTLLLQVIKHQFPRDSSVFYFSADHFYFDQTSLYAFIEQRYLREGTTTFFIDEIHQYKNWNQEIKNIYDGFPDIKLIFSGSSSLDLIKGSYDLSRRAKLYHLPGMSFREYLNFETGTRFEKITFEALILNPKKYDALLTEIPKIKGHFDKYLSQGFYPFYAENPLSYHEKLIEVIEKTIYEDIANFFSLKTTNLHHFKKILSFLASIPPGQVNVHNIAKNLSIDDKTVFNYLHILNETGLVNLIYPSESGNSGLRRPEKIFLNNVNLLYALVGNIGSPVNIGNVRELFFIQAIQHANMHVFHSKTGDYKVEDVIFEIGGRNKTKEQIQHIDNAFIVKDDILISSHRTIPLMLFGFLY